MSRPSTTPEARAVRRLFVGTVSFLALTGTVLVLPVYAAPTPPAHPVAATTDSVRLGSVAAPAPAADVQSGTSTPVSGISPTAPTLTLTRAHTDPFSLVGVTWRNDPNVTDTVVRVRVQNSAGNWGTWTQADIEDAEQNRDARSGATLRGGTEPLWTGPSTGVDVELVTRSGAQPTDVQLDLVDPGRSTADKMPGPPAAKDQAHAAASMPPVYSRAQWGADESIRTWDPEYASTIKAATIHHTDDTNDYTADQVPAMLRAIYQYHAVSRGWGDIGYNVLADKFGRLWEGRFGGLASTVIAAHAGGFNTYTFGVSLIGNYDQVAPPPAMVDSVSAFIAWKFSLYGVDPYGGTTLVSAGGGTAKYAAGTAVNLPTIFGHRDVGSTVCPGQYAYADLPQIREKVADVLGASVTPQIAARYNSDPSLQATLGAKTGYERQGAGVVWQPYQGGALFYSPDTGVKLVHGAVLGEYLAAGGPAALGAPTVEEKALPDSRGVVASFQGADIYWTPTTGAHVVHGAVRARWSALGATTSWLGYPVTDEQPTANGVVAGFEHGLIAWSPATGPQALGGAIGYLFDHSGRADTPLGFPTAEEGDSPGGRTQAFQGGSAWWSPATGAAYTYGAIGGDWYGLGGPTSAFGYPTQNERNAGNGGRGQNYQSGAFFWSPATGAHGVRGAVLGAWGASGGEGGPAGYPITEQLAVGDGRGQLQRFQSGSVFWTPTTGAHLARGAIGNLWFASGDVHGALGYPTGDEVNGAVAGSRTQAFENGTIYWSPGTGAHIVRGTAAAAYSAAGGAAGMLGLPTSEAVVAPDGAGRVQYFQGGQIASSDATGAHAVRGGIGWAWNNAGGVSGTLLGYPTSDETDTPGGGGRMQYFQRGRVYWSAATGPHIVRGDIAVAYDGAGGVTGLMGLPTADAVPTADGVGRMQTFQGGTYYWSPSTGAHIVRGAIGWRWQTTGGPTGWLGYPVTDETGTPTGASQRFQHGTVTWTAATGLTAVI